MAMKVVKKTENYTIYSRRDGRYAVTDPDRKPVNGEDKVRILVEEGLLKVAAPAPKAEPEPEAAAETEAPAEEAEAEAAAETEAPAESEGGEEAPAE
jgi:hypothetical protein